MKVLIWGVPCVGKTQIAPLLASKLNCKFIDINTLIKEKYQTIDKFHDTFPNIYNRFKEIERIVFDVINNNDNFIMTITLIYIEEIVKEILDTNTISVELIDSVESIYDRTLFYDENDELMPDSKEYRDSYKKYYIEQIKNDKKTSYLEYKDIPKFNINNRKFEYIIDELTEYINELALKK